MKTLMVRKTHLIVVFLVLFSFVTLQQQASASPFGVGKFGEDVPFGSATAITIGISGGATLTMTPSGGTISGSGSHTVTVTSTDVVGYKLYVSSPVSTNMVNGSFTIPASSNSTASALATNTWGFNTSGSTSNFIGMKTTATEIKDTTGPFKNGDDTTVTYGALVDRTKGSGTYTVNVDYLATGESP